MRTTTRSGVRPLGASAVALVDTQEVLVWAGRGDHHRPQVLDHARRHLAGFKLPRRVHVLAELPRTGIGKISRSDLRDRAHPSVRRGAHQ